MFGRIRSSSSLDSLDRPSSKILKDDCLSIYEATLMKLKLGSQNDSSPSTKEASEGRETGFDLNSSCAEAMNLASCNAAKSSKGSHELANAHKEDLMTVDSDFSTTSTCTTEASGDCQSTEYSSQLRVKDFSILYLFSKFKSSPGSSTAMEEITTTEDICNDGMSSSSCASQFSDSIDLHSKQESVDSLATLSENIL